MSRAEIVRQVGSAARPHSFKLEQPRDAITIGGVGARPERECGQRAEPPALPDGAADGEGDDGGLYRFADYKEAVIDLLKRVCTVSVKTVEIINRMPKED